MQVTCNEAPNILGHAWPPDLPLKGFNGLSHAEVAHEGTAVYLFQERLLEAMVGQDDKLEDIQLGEQYMKDKPCTMHMQNLPSAEAACARFYCKVASSY